MIINVSKNQGVAWTFMSYDINKIKSILQNATMRYHKAIVCLVLLGLSQNLANSEYLTGWILHYESIWLIHFKTHNLKGFFKKKHWIFWWYILANQLKM